MKTSPATILYFSPKKALEETPPYQGFLGEKLKEMERAIILLARASLKEKQLRLLCKLEEFEGLLQYRVVEKISLEEGIPLSTVRWNLARLKSAGLIMAGDKENKGIPVHLTSEGQVIVSTLKGVAGEKISLEWDMRSNRGGGKT